MDFKLKAKGKGGNKAHTSRKKTSLVGIDFGISATKVVRIKKEKDSLSLVDGGILPAIHVDQETAFELPRSMKDRYVAMCATLPESQVRLFSHDGKENFDMQKEVREKLNVSDEEIRAKGLVIGEQKKQQSIMGISVPENIVKNYLSIFEEGAPAPCSLEVSALASTSAFLFNKGDKSSSRTICLIELGESVTYVSFFHKNQVQIVNRFDLGARDLSKAVMKSLGLEEELAINLLMEGMVDVSAVLSDTLSPILRQLPVLKEFTERKNNSSLSGVYLSGGLATATAWQGLIKDSLGIEPESWNPFEKIKIPEEGLPESMQGQESRFASAVGAALSELGL